MKSKHYILLLMFPLLFLQQGCNKDYPNDIPRWLKQKIKEREKECKNGGCSCTDSGLGCWTIYEWDENGTIYYVNHKGFSDLSNNVYVETWNSEGIVICDSYYDKVGLGGLTIDELLALTCSEYLKNGYIKREIWKNGN